MSALYAFGYIVGVLLAWGVFLTPIAVPLVLRYNRRRAQPARVSVPSAPRPIVWDSIRGEYL